MPSAPKKPSKAAAKSATKTSAPRKKAPKRSSSVTTVEVVVLEDAPNLLPEEVENQVLSVEELLGKAEEMSDQLILNAISNYSSEATKYSGIALKAGASALVFAWGCGCLLNAAKERLGHGEFGKWRKKLIEGNYMSERTSMRYMKLAARCGDIRALLQWAPTLKQAYVDCGILPEPPERQNNDSSEDNADAQLTRKKVILLSVVSNLQQKMQQCVDIEGRLDDDERRQLRLAKREIDAFFSRILVETT